MKKILSLLLLTAVLFSLCSCSAYTSSYRAVKLIKSNNSHSCSASFGSLEGTLVFKLKKSDVGSEGDISYSITVEEGELYLFYDIYGIKEELAHVKAGESIESRGGYIEGGKTVYVIIEAPVSTKGKISVELDN